MRLSPAAWFPFAPRLRPCLAILAILLPTLLAGCSSPSDGGADDATPSASPYPACDDLSVAAHGFYAVLYVEGRSLGPEGTVATPLANLTVEASFEGETYDSRATDARGCVAFGWQGLGLHRFANATLDGCGWTGGREVRFDGVGSRVVLIPMEMPCA